MDEAKKIIKEIKAKNYYPIYFLMGDEPYFIDIISDYIQHHVLEEHERDFNQTIVYGKDTTIDEIVSASKRFPMMNKEQWKKLDVFHNRKRNFPKNKNLKK